MAAASCSSACSWGLSSTTANDIYTIAGSSTGTAGSSGDGGAATSAVLSGPAGLGVDPSGNLYIADATNDKLREGGNIGRPSPGISLDAEWLCARRLALDRVHLHLRL